MLRNGHLTSQAKGLKMPSMKTLVRRAKRIEAQKNKLDAATQKALTRHASEREDPVTARTADILFSIGQRLLREAITMDYWITEGVTFKKVTFTNSSQTQSKTRHIYTLKRRVYVPITRHSRNQGVLWLSEDGMFADIFHESFLGVSTKLEILLQSEHEHIRTIAEEERDKYTKA